MVDDYHEEERSHVRNLSRTISLLISDLNDERVVVRHPISIIVEEFEYDGSLARWPETNTFGAGPNFYQTIRDLKQNIVSHFLDLSERDEGEFGEFGVETLSTLRAYIYKKEKMPCPEWELGDEIKGKGILDLDDILRASISRSIWRLRCIRCAQSIMTNAETRSHRVFDAMACRSCVITSALPEVSGEVRLAGVTHLEYQPLDMLGRLIKHLVGMRVGSGFEGEAAQYWQDYAAKQDRR